VVVDVPWECFFSGLYGVAADLLVVAQGSREDFTFFLLVMTGVLFSEAFLFLGPVLLISSRTGVGYAIYT